jgi:hypothetical protein
MKRRVGIAAMAVLTAGFASAQVQEIFSKQVTIQSPRGEFVRQLIKFSPAEGKEWKPVALPDSGIRLMSPQSAEVNLEAKDSRQAEIILGASDEKPRAKLRIDVFKPNEGEPTEIDLDYANDYAAEYPIQAFKGKFEVTDSGLVLLEKKQPPLALVGGLYSTPDAPAYRLQLCSLTKHKQVFLTFDCMEGKRDAYAPLLAKMLLTLDLGDKKK